MTSPPDPIAVAPPEPRPGPGRGTIPLPSIPQSPAALASGLRSRGRGLGFFLTVLVLALAFLAGSFLARNSDLWFHLATGRLLAQRKLSFFGADPFTYTTGQMSWVCHAWLFDLALYGLYQGIGGAGLVVLKALVVTALAGLLLWVRRPAGAMWLPAVFTTLAVLAMSPRLMLQPACVSYLLLGLTFWLLWRPHAESVDARQESRGGKEGPAFRRLSAACWLPLVFFLWVNVDEWFLLGPLLAGLFWLGERLGGQRQTPGWVMPAGLAACLLNPYTFHAFTLPAELSPVTWTSGLRQDARFQAYFASPWQPAHLGAAAHLNAAALAYYVLTLLGLTSFVLHRRALRDWRLVVWLPFALLAGWQARAIPFFAIVAAPITCLNWQDLFVGRRDQEARTKVLAAAVGAAGRFSLVLGLLALLLLTWSGWLAGYDREERHVAWGIQAEPSLQQVTETLKHWRRRGLLADNERIFAVAPEVAQYGAWFCPGERQFFDHRYPLFPQAARDYETVCLALLPELAPSSARVSPALPGLGSVAHERAWDWRQVLEAHGVGIVVIYDREPERLFAVLRRLAGDSERWTLLLVAGDALIVGWNEARAPGGFAPLAFDADRLVFGPQDDGAGRAAPAAPVRGPAQVPPPRDLQARLIRPAAQAAWESAAATVYLHYFNDSEAAQRKRQWRSSWGGYAASVAGLSARPAAVPQVAFEFMASRNLLHLPQDAEPQFLVREQLGPFFAPLVDRPPALPLLAIRAARRAVAANPQDANAWLRLGQAYLLVRNLTVEHSGEGVLPPLAQLRHAQVVTALEEAVRLDPDLEAAHHELAYLYGERNYLDQALEHRQEELRLSRRAGRRAGETAEEFADRLEAVEKDTAKLVDLVEDRRKKYASASRSLQGDRLAQAGMALRLGLARQATDKVLMPAPADLLGAAGIKLELELLLSLGRAQEVRGILNDKAVRTNKHGLAYYDLAPPQKRDGGVLYALPYHWPAYEWLHVLESAAVGDYAQTQGDLRAIRAGLHAGHERLVRQPRDFEGRIRTLLPGLLSGPPPFLPAFAAGALSRVVEERTMVEAGEPALRAQEADLCVLEGLLALEQGDPDTARSAFIEALELCANPPVPFAGRPIAGGYVGKLTATYP
jgi:tetratricopeptide (TPR) repeat protein